MGDQSKQAKGNNAINSATETTKNKSLATRSTSEAISQSKKRPAHTGGKPKKAAVKPKAPKTAKNVTPQLIDEDDEPFVPGYPSDRPVIPTPEVHSLVEPDIVLPIPDSSPVRSTHECQKQNSNPTRIILRTRTSSSTKTINKSPAAPIIPSHPSSAASAQMKTALEELDEILNSDVEKESSLQEDETSSDHSDHSEQSGDSLAKIDDKVAVIRRLKPKGLKVFEDNQDTEDLRSAISLLVKYPYTDRVSSAGHTAIFVANSSFDSIKEILDSCGLTRRTYEEKKKEKEDADLKMSELRSQAKQMAPSIDAATKEIEDLRSEIERLQKELLTKEDALLPIKTQFQSTLSEAKTVNVRRSLLKNELAADLGKYDDACKGYSEMRKLVGDLFNAV